MAHKKILIMGDSNRGKTTLAKQLSRIYGIKLYSTDDFFWEVKFTKKRDKAESVKMISKVYENDSWIVEGTSRNLIRPALEDSDLIIHLVHRRFIPQARLAIRRGRMRQHERAIDTWYLLKHLFKKHFEIDRERRKEHLREMLSPHKAKTVELDSFEAIDDYVEKSRKELKQKNKNDL